MCIRWFTIASLLFCSAACCRAVCQYSRPGTTGCLHVPWRWQDDALMKNSDLQFVERLQLLSLLSTTPAQLRYIKDQFLDHFDSIWPAEWSRWMRKLLFWTTTRIATEPHKRITLVKLHVCVDDDISYSMWSTSTHMCLNLSYAFV